MKILPRKELTTLKQQEETVEIQRGAKLAQQVDTLRQMRITEEENLKRFREKSLETVQDDINQKAQEKLLLEEQIAQKKKEWEALLAPLDKQFALYVKTERGNIEAAQAEIEQHRATLQKQAEHFASTLASLQEQEKQLKREKLDIAEMRKITQKERHDAEHLLVEAKKTVKILQEDAEKLRVASQKQFELAKSESNRLKLLQSELKTKESLLEDREMAVIIKELQYYSPVKTLNKK